MRISKQAGFQSIASHAYGDIQRQAPHPNNVAVVRKNKKGLQATHYKKSKKLHHKYLTHRKMCVNIRQAREIATHRLEVRMYESDGDNQGNHGAARNQIVGVIWTVGHSKQHVCKQDEAGERER